MYLEVSSYENNGRLYIGAFNVSDNEFYGDITINIHELFVTNTNECYLNANTNSYGLHLIPKMKELGIIAESYGEYSVNYGSYEYVRIDIDKLKKYDKKGVEEYLNLLKEKEISNSLSI